jgi:Tol biopolymer transport system component
LGISSILFGQDAKKLLMVGQTARGELNRFDKKSGKFVTFLGGISAEYSSFSKDGQWVAYVMYPEGTLWRSKVDGSERLQLTYPPGYAMMPRWSPDGKKIVFYQTFTDRPCRMYELPAEGGIARELLPEDKTCQQDPNWSPDGNKVIFGNESGNPDSTIRMLDLTTHQVTTLPESKGLFSPRWSADGRYIPAFSADLTRLMVFDMQTQQWTQLVRGTLGWLNWTHDGQRLQVLDTSGLGAVLEVRLSDGQTVRLADLKSFPIEGRYHNSLATAPDDSPLLLRNAGTQDVYALELEEQ